MKLLCALGIGLLAAAWATANSDDRRPDRKGDWRLELPAILRELDSGDWSRERPTRVSLARLGQRVGDPLKAALDRHLDKASPAVKAAVERQLAYMERPHFREYWDLLAIFDALGLGHVKGKTFVVYNTGAFTPLDEDSICFDYVHGWLLSEGEEKIAILSAEFTSREYARAYDLPDNWQSFKEKHPDDKPLPGQYKQIDWEGFCDEFVQSGVDNKLRFARIIRLWGPALMPAAEAAVCGYWCYQRGDLERALKLFKLADGATQDEAESRESEDPTRPAASPSLLERIREELFQTFHHWAIIGAHHGEPRKDLLEYWMVAASFCSRRNSGYLEEEDMRREYNPWLMAESYRSLIAEDEKWREPSEDAFRSMSRAEKAEYWLHQLRDLAASQWSQPGGVAILPPLSGIPEEENAAEQLRRLGWDAIPVLVEHLDDLRPTRSMGFWRSFAPDSYYLLDHGDCCARILFEVTGCNVETKKAAEAWWEKHKMLGPEAYYRDLLESGEKWKCFHAAERLVELDRENYLPRLIERVRRETPDRSPGVFEAIVDELDKEHEMFLAECLSAKDDHIVYRASWMLWRKCQSDVGVRELVRRVKRFSIEESQRHSVFHLMNLLTEVREEFVVEAISEFVRHPVKEIRDAALDHAGKVIDRRVLESLVPILDDKASTGAHGEYEIRYADKAAVAICKMLDYEITDGARSQDPQVRDLFIEELKTYIRSNVEKINWRGLRGKSGS